MFCYVVSTSFQCPRSLEGPSDTRLACNDLVCEENGFWKFMVQPNRRCHFSTHLKHSIIVVKYNIFHPPRLKHHAQMYSQVFMGKVSSPSKSRTAEFACKQIMQVQYIASTRGDTLDFQLWLLWKNTIQPKLSFKYQCTQDMFDTNQSKMLDNDNNAKLNQILPTLIDTFCIFLQLPLKGTWKKGPE